MEKIKAAKLPGFYMDERGAYGIVIGTFYICCFINQSNDEYDVTVDTIDENGDFALNLEWESYKWSDDAINCLRRMTKRYAAKSK